MPEPVVYSEFVGKTIIIGVTRLDHQGNIRERSQLHGVISRADSKGIAIELSSREMFYLPPDLSALSPAPPGEYRFKSTGEVIVNPDFMTTWSVHPKPLDDDTKTKT